MFSYMAQSLKVVGKANYIWSVLGQISVFVFKWLFKESALKFLKFIKKIHPIEDLNYKVSLYKRKYIKFTHFILALHKINWFNQGLLSEKWRP